MLIFSTTFACNFSFRTARDLIVNVHRFSCKVPVTVVRFYCNSNVLGRFSKNTQISNFIKIRATGAALFHENGSPDMTKLTVTFSDFAKRLTRYKIWWMYYFIRIHRKTSFRNTLTHHSNTQMYVPPHIKVIMIWCDIFVNCNWSDTRWQ